MYYSLMSIAGIVIFFILMLLCVIIGQRLGKNKQTTGLSVTEGAVFTLMGLLVAFTFSSANQRFDLRRSFIIEETNAISTAYLRLDLLIPKDRLTLQDDFLSYVTARIAIYESILDLKAVTTELRKLKEIQARLWLDAVNACKNSVMTASMLILPSINAMFDIANTRTAYTYFHPHFLIFMLLIVVALLSALLTGYGMASKGKWASIHVIAFALIITLTIYIIIDLEYPRLAIIKESKFDSLLVNIKNDFLHVK